MLPVSFMSQTMHTSLVDAVFTIGLLAVFLLSQAIMPWVKQVFLFEDLREIRRAADASNISSSSPLLNSPLLSSLSPLVLSPPCVCMRALCVCYGPLCPAYVALRIFMTRIQILGLQGALALLNIETGVESISEVEAGIAFLVMLVLTEDLKLKRR